ncbi:MAG: hypothetical protein PF961_21715 [Planctomycetota bacterium]|jgi:hypothetical protein|nr:hypothetical protein [Planctomycetota bacterium]
MRVFIAILGNVLGLGLLLCGLWFIAKDIEGKESVLSHAGFLLVVIAVPVLAIGSEMIGEIRGRAAQVAKRNEPVAKPDDG